MNAPRKVFISHASEDKVRFVTSFAKRLRECGINAWYAEWEIQPGDSLVEKIFEDGIRDADAFVIVLSKNSVGKPWVREELNVGMVQKIQKRYRIIPIILEDCDVPTALTHLRWERIENLSDYEAEFLRIVNVIYGGSDRPPLGPPPVTTREQTVNFFPRLTKTDNRVFRILGEYCLSTGRRSVTLSQIAGEFEAMGLSQAEVFESLEVLEEHFYLNRRNSVRAFNPESGASEIKHVSVNDAALATFAQRVVPEYDKMVLDVVSGIVNRGWRLRKDFESLDLVPPIVLEVIVRSLEGRGLVQLVTGSNGLFFQVEPKGPKLKRMLES